MSSCYEHCRHLLNGEEVVKNCHYSELIGDLADRYAAPNFDPREVVVCEIE